MVDALVSVAAENLLQMARYEAKLLIGVHRELEDLSRELKTIRAVLHDAEMKQIKDEAVRIWLQNLKYVAYEIEDMVEAWDQVRNSSSPFSCMLHPFRHFKFGHKVKTIREKLAKIASEKDRYHLREIAPVSEHQDRQTSSFVEQSSVIGRDRDSEMLREKLMEDLACKEVGVPVIAIVGMGGVGKTTLAQVVFNSETIKNHFSKCIWVCISNNFIVKDAMISIIKNSGGSISQNEENQVELLQRKLVELIENKRYLLVLDDVWNDDELKWAPLQNILNRGANGSRIVVTTRNHVVARAMRNVHILDLGVLANDDCWSIFKKLVFEESNDGQGYKDLEKVGKQIVEKCRGLPLAVKTIASALRKKARGKQPTRGLLENILNSEIWHVSESDVGILPALMLSYIELPSKLKNCFCYCSLFEKDFIFKKDDLTKMWVAQGYIVANDEQGEIECIAEEYFDELLDRSLFQEPELDEYGNITSCKMHDLVHDLAQWLTKTEFSIMKMIDPKNRLMSLGNARHCAILEELRWKKDIALTGVENLRTLIFLLGQFIIFEESQIGGVIKHLQSVRVLSLQQVRMRELCGLERLVHLRYLSLCLTEIEELPKSIGKLKELRYLDLSRTRIRTLPETITSLSHLQTLNLFYCKDLRELPGGIPGMGSLRHLDVSECLMKKLPDGIGGLTLLQTLGRFPVALGGGNGGCSNIGELGGLNRLRGCLSIYNLGVVGSLEEARSAKLQDKTSLVDISLHWGSGEPLNQFPLDENSLVAKDVLERLRPPPKLEALLIDFYPGGAFPSCMCDGSALPLLGKMQLCNCKNCTQLPPLGQLPCLESLTIFHFAGVEEVGKEFLHDEGGTSIIAFPQLKSLEFSYMDSWKWWAPPLSTSSPSPSSIVPVNTTILPRLRELRLYRCPKLEGVPPIFTTALQTLCIGYCPMLRSLQFLPPSIQSLELRGVSTGKLLADCPTGTLPSLQHLEIGDDSKLTADQLPLHLSTTLHSLRIVNCKNLRTLPEGLTRLTRLQIYRCSPELHASFQKEGPLRPRIAHIPRIKSDCPTGTLQWTICHWSASSPSLEISGCKSLRTLPEGLTRLTTLEILGCSQICVWALVSKGGWLLMYLLYTLINNGLFRRIVSPTISLQNSIIIILFGSCIIIYITY